MVKKHSSDSRHYKSPHRSFRRTYREDYIRELNVPGMGQHIYESFWWFVKEHRVFLPLFMLVSLSEILVVNLTYETTMVFTILIFLLIWLTVIFVLRQRMAKHQVGLRDALYNSMTPLVSSLVVFITIVIQCVPIFLLLMAYSAAIQTEFLNMPFYAFLFLGFAGLMITISSYLLSSSLIALVAVSAPGIYPWKALMTAAELMIGRRIRFLLRIVALIMMLGLLWMIILLPLSVLKLPSEVLAVIVAILSCFSMIYTTIYLYLYYRYLLDA